MSLVGYKAGNHPQQVGRRGADPARDDRATTPEVFDPLHKRFRFTLDVAAAAHNAKCERYYTVDDDGLGQSWSGERVWCNPPYSNVGAWVEKAWAEFGRTCRCCAAELVVLLVPGRLRFIQAGRTEVGPNERPPFGCCLLIWGDG